MNAGHGVPIFVGVVVSALKENALRASRASGQQEDRG